MLVLMHRLSWTSCSRFPIRSTTTSPLPCCGIRYGRLHVLCYDASTSRMRHCIVLHVAIRALAAQGCQSGPLSQMPDQCQGAPRRTHVCIARTTGPADKRVCSRECMHICALMLCILIEHFLWHMTSIMRSNGTHAKQMYTRQEERAAYDLENVAINNQHQLSSIFVWHNMTRWLM